MRASRLRVNPYLSMSTAITDSISSSNGTQLIHANSFNTSTGPRWSSEDWRHALPNEVRIDYHFYILQAWKVMNMTRTSSERGICILPIIKSINVRWIKVCFRLMCYLYCIQEVILTVANPQLWGFCNKTSSHCVQILSLTLVDVLEKVHNLSFFKITKCYLKWTNSLHL